MEGMCESKGHREEKMPESYEEVVSRNSLLVKRIVRVHNKLIWG